MRILRFIRKESSRWFRAFMHVIPGRIGEGCRNRFYGYHAGKGARVLTHVVIYHPDKFFIGENSAIAAYCQLNAGGGIELGKDVLIGPGSMIWSQNHCVETREQPIRVQGYTREPVIIDDDVWIAARAVVLPGVHLGTGTVVAAGAVVTKSTEPYSIVAGVPARKVGERGVKNQELEPSNPTASSKSGCAYTQDTGTASTTGPKDESLAAHSR